VQCLECEHISTTTESFLHLSLPIPSKDYLNTLHTRLVHKQQQQNNRNNNNNVQGSTTNHHTADNSNHHHNSSSFAENNQQQQQQTVAAYQQGWLSWIVDTMKSFMWSQTIKLSDCLTAFFSDDDLKDDNMYSCDKCKKYYKLFFLNWLVFLFIYHSKLEEFYTLVSIIKQKINHFIRGLIYFYNKKIFIALKLYNFI
jgi:ubiquitin carboxyl-terminal hydrolase 20/33